MWRNQFLLCGCDQRCVENMPELRCSPGQSPTEQSPEVSGAGLSSSEMICESDRLHSSRRDHPHPMGAVEAWKSFCLCVCVWACNLGAMRAGLSFGALKAKAKSLPRDWPSAGQGWLGGGGYWEAPGAAQLPWGARGLVVATTRVAFPSSLPQGCPWCPTPWVSHQVPIPPGRDSTPVFRAPHILLMTYGLSGGSCQEVGWTLLQQTWIHIEKPSFIQSKERKKNPAAMPAGRLCSAINRRCLFYTKSLHPTSESRNRFLPVQATCASATYADAGRLCLSSFVLLWHVELKIKSSKLGCWGRRKWKV